MHDKPLAWRLNLTLLGMGVFSFVLFRLFSLAPVTIDLLFSRGINPVMVRWTSRVTGLLPFSILEPLVIAYGVRILYLTGLAVTKTAKRTRSVRNVAARGLLRVARDTGVLLTLFYVMWGFNYARDPLRERFGWPEFTPPDIEVLANLARRAVDSSNAAYLAIHDTSDAGRPTPMPDNLRELDEALEQGWTGVTAELSLDSHFGKRYGRSKRLLLTPLIARFGISGFYFPWTAEANVLRDTPAVTRPQSMAHEKAHQRGVGPEEEASFLGYMAGSRSPSINAQYAAHVFAQIQLLRVLAAEDRELARSVANNRYPGVQRDLEDASEYWASKRGPATEVGRAVNHSFLRANRVRGGVASYRMSVRLIITQMLLENDLID